MATTFPPLIEKVPKPNERFSLRYNLHPGQQRAHDSTKRIVAVIAGVRSGKTSYAPIWLRREMMARGPGDYLVAAPSYPLLDKAAVSEIDHYFRGILNLGKITRQPYGFQFSDYGCTKLFGHVPERRPRLFFGHGDSPESLAAMTLKAAWLDEAGMQRFKVGSYEEIQRRLAIDKGRTLLTTTPYAQNWLKFLILDPWEAAGRQHPEIDVVHFDATKNPAMPREEWERAMRDLPRWKFDLFWRGILTRPPGLIYDSFDSKLHVRPPKAIPLRWERYGGIDFGGVNLAAVMCAAEQAQDGTPTGRLIAYREYHPGKRPPKEHVAAILKDEPREPTMVGGAASEDDWRDRFAEAGLSIIRPIVRDVEVGIDAVHAAFKNGVLLIHDDLHELLDELSTYSRVLDEQGEPTEAIESKETFHLLDSLRYLVGWLCHDDSMVIRDPSPEAQTFMSRMPREIAATSFANQMALTPIGDPYASPDDDSGGIQWGEMP